MRILVLFFAILLSFSSVFAVPFKKSSPSVSTSATPFPIDEEFQTDFVGYDEKEGKLLQKQEKAQAKLDKKRKELELKKVKLEKKKAASVKNCERSQEYIEKLKSHEENPNL